MRTLFSALVILSMLLTSVGPVFAQDGVDAGDSPGGSHLYLPSLQRDVEPGRVNPEERKPKAPKKEKDKAKVTHGERKAAAARRLQDGALNPLMVELAAPPPLIEGAPRYFSHPNYANSPLPEVNGATITVGNPLIDRSHASDYPVAVGELAPVLVVLPQTLPDGVIQSFQVWNQATPGAAPFPSAGNVFHVYVLRPTGNTNEYTVFFDSGLLTMPALANPAVSELATFPVANLGVQAGDRLAFYGQGIPVDVEGGTDTLVYPVPSPLLADPEAPITLGSAAYPILTQARTYSFGAEVLDLSGANVVISGGIRKFVDPLPGLSIATPDTTTYAGSDYYEIAVVEYTQQLHRDLPPTKLRGYVQLETAVVQGAHHPLPGGKFAVAAPTYLGASIVATKDRPVRIKFYNLLPTGAGGNLFIPTDTTVMGSGMTPKGHTEMDPTTADPQNPECSGPDKAMMVMHGHCYAENRATLHLHGGITPWISDGTPHQWITPAGEQTAYPQGVSVVPVPDMGAASDTPTDGTMTFYYTNQQSARLMFYHDHAYGITRLNVYVGEAAGYIITDDTEKQLVNQGIIPGPADTLHLIVQDKTFVPSDEQLALQDETWDTARWGGKGSLWMPHVYSPAQNPGDASGVNEFGRWAYGPWFWPPTNNIEHGPVANPYFDPACDPDAGWCEPSLMPGVPYLSMGMESFNDTPTVNGVPYPTLTIEPKSYRLRILNGANDRFFNLSLYKAIDANGNPCDASNPSPAAESTGVACTEVLLNSAEVEAALEDPAAVFPTPVQTTAGPNWIQFGTEGGFLPSPVEIPAQPITWVSDPTVFNAGNVDKHSLLLGPAERADVVVDFSQYAGQTLILYNDAPAAFPARDPRYDYYTGNPDLRDTGGAPSTLPGYGPNTRTVMQIKVAGTPASPYNVNALKTAFKATSLGGLGVFEQSQPPIIVGQAGYNDAYGKSFKGNDGLVQIHQTALAFPTLNGAPLTINIKPKQIQDEMGEAFELEYGRMSGFLGVETPNSQAGLQNMVLMPYTFPPTEVIDGIELPAGVNLQPIASADDGTQIWKITHNGVDTHPIHWHLYDVQLINRVGWDGIIRKPDPNELGWKDTIRVSPLEDTIVALRPLIPQLPATWGGLPNSVRLLDPTMPEGEYLMGANTSQREAMGLPLLAFNPDGEPVDIVNHYANFGWEYVLHCHILSHEEMDMMRSQVVGVAPAAPTNVTFTLSGNGNNRIYTVNWTDNSKNETAFVIERRIVNSGAAWSVLATVASERFNVVPFVKTGVGAGTGSRSYVDRIGNTRNVYEYRVTAVNVVGDVWDYSNPAFNQIPAGGGWPTLTIKSAGPADPPVPPVAAPTNLAASVAAKNKKTANVTLTWTDNANNETGFLIQRADNAAFSAGVVNATVGADVRTLTQGVTPGKTYYYRVHAFNATTQSGWSNTATVPVP